jgi:diaminohydroxyphosphoribosylaminopyrimidine deaminase/5-amino-6-(5-phosphoribosylamino)uracil reductase
MNHTHHMQHALALGRRNLGQTWPNPSVGAVVIKDGQVIGEGSTGRGGRPHAETEALKAADVNAKDATLHVTLEPCSHHGKTSPCVDAIIAAGIKTCVVACCDPHPNVNGQGIAKLKNAGIEVIEGVCEQEARRLHEGFFSVVQKKRPFVAVKIATSRDEKITTGVHGKQWITSETAREYGHKLRGEYDAILTGIGTVLEDDPLLTCRLPGLEDKSPVRVVLDRQLRIPMDSKLVRTAGEVPLWIFYSSSRQKPGYIPHCLNKKNIEWFDCAGSSLDPGFCQDDEEDLRQVLHLLAAQGITRVLVEAGQKITSAFLESGLVDRIYWFKAPVKIGNSGLPALLEPKIGLSALAQRHPVEHINLLPDTLDVIELCSPALSTI